MTRFGGYHIIKMYCMILYVLMIFLNYVGQLQYQRSCWANKPPRLFVFMLWQSTSFVCLQEWSIILSIFCRLIAILYATDMNNMVFHLYGIYTDKISYCYCLLYMTIVKLSIYWWQMQWPSFNFGNNFQYIVSLGVFYLVGCNLQLIS